MKNRFSIYRVENVITAESSRQGDYASSEPTETEPADLRDAIEALESDCWDTVDLSGNAIICYPADYSQNYRTGDYEGSELIISGEFKDLARLLDTWNVIHNRAELAWRDGSKGRVTLSNAAKRARGNNV